MAGLMSPGQGRGRLVILLVCVAVAALLLVPRLLTQKQRLSGLLVDLELEGPDLQRYADIRDAFVTRLPKEMPSLSDLDVSLQYVHFAEADAGLLGSEAVDFVVLSPQGTPWYMYRGDAGKKLDLLKARVRDLVHKGRKPVLGICGGHQFLALAFGGSVDFIDGRFLGKFPERYPSEAVSERGAVQLETVRDDPILRGVARHPGTFVVMQSHYEEVKAVPEPFVNLAKSRMSEAQLLTIPGRLVYGTAFHPERGWDAVEGNEYKPSAGKQVLANFLTMVRDHKRSVVNGR